MIPERGSWVGILGLTVVVLQTSMLTSLSASTTTETRVSHHLVKSHCGEEGKQRYKASASLWHPTGEDLQGDQNYPINWGIIPWWRRSMTRGA